MVTLGLLLCSVACVLVLHLVRSDLGPIAHRLSEYANGPYDYLMTAAFVGLGLGMVAVGVALVVTGEMSEWRWLVPVMVAGAGIGMIVSGIYPTNPFGADTTAEQIHSRASAFSSAALIASAITSSVLRRRGRPGRRLDGPDVLAILALAIGCLSPAFHESAWSGLSQRVLWVVLVGWLLLTSWQLGSSGGSSWSRKSPSQQSALR